jgi:hypothetical protein
MINIKTKNELYEFSVRNSTEFRLDFPGRDRDVTILFYDTDYSHPAESIRTTGCGHRNQILPQADPFASPL